VDSKFHPLEREDFANFFNYSGKHAIRGAAW